MYVIPTFFLAMFFICESTIIPEEKEGLVIEGRNAVFGQFPYAAALHYKNAFRCTCSILSPTTILTAAHCIVTNGEVPPANLFHVIANVNRSAETYKIDFKELIVHPGYPDNHIMNDLAVMKTKLAIPFDGEIPIQQICIPRPDTPARRYLNATAMGWGTTSRTDPSAVPEILQYTEQIIMPNRYCQLFQLSMDRNKLCAYAIMSGICTGDSGGPLVHLSANKPPVEIGITSYVSALFPCATVPPAVFVRVSKYTNFILKVANDSKICVV